MKCKCGKRNVVPGIGTCWTCYGELNPEVKEINSGEKMIKNKKSNLEKVKKILEEKEYVSIVDIRGMFGENKKQIPPFVRYMTSELNLKTKQDEKYGLIYLRNKRVTMPERMKADQFVLDKKEGFTINEVKKDLEDMFGVRPETVVHGLKQKGKLVVVGKIGNSFIFLNPKFAKQDKEFVKKENITLKVQQENLELKEKVKKLEEKLEIKEEKSIWQKIKERF
jgi:hypothetical protein